MLSYAEPVPSDPQHKLNFCVRFVTVLLQQNRTKISQINFRYFHISVASLFLMLLWRTGINDVLLKKRLENICDRFRHNNGNKEHSLFSSLLCFVLESDAFFCSSIIWIFYYVTSSCKGPIS